MVAKLFEQRLVTFTFPKPSSVIMQFSVVNHVAHGYIRNNISALMDPLSAALMLAALEKVGKSVSEFIEEVPEYITIRKNIVCKNEQKYKLVDQLSRILKAEFPEYTDFSVVDGARLALKNGWLLIRASGTEPLIRLTVEGESQEVAKDITAKATALIHKQIEAQN